MFSHSVRLIVHVVLAILLVAMATACDQPTPTGSAPTATVPDAGAAYEEAIATAVAQSAAAEDAAATAVAQSAAAEDTAATALSQAAAAGDTAAAAEDGAAMAVAQSAAAELAADQALARADTALITAQTAISMTACLKSTEVTAVGGGLAIHFAWEGDVELVLDWSLDDTDAFLSYAAFQNSPWRTTSGRVRLALIATSEGDEPGILYYDQSLDRAAWDLASAWSDYSTYEEQSPDSEDSRSFVHRSPKSPLAASEAFDPGSGGTVGQSLDNLEIAGGQVNGSRWLLLDVETGQGSESVLIRFGEGSGAGTPGSVQLYCASCVTGYCCYACYKAGYPTSCYSYY